MNADGYNRNCSGSKKEMCMRMKAWLRPVSLTAALGLTLAALVWNAGCTQPYSGKSSAEFQNATIDALLDGNYDGDMPFSELKRHGDFGLGTFDHLDGEMVALHGTFYQVTSDGHVHVADDAMKSPFSAVTFFRSGTARPLTAAATYHDLQTALDGMRQSDGRVFAFCVEGRFAHVRVRSVPRQKPPYRRLAEVTKEQTVFDLKDVSGTLVGFWFPESLRHVNVPGYHFHFLTNDRTAGGHVLDLKMIDGTVRMQELKVVKLALGPHAPATRPAQERPPAAGELDSAEK